MESKVKNLCGLYLRVSTEDQAREVFSLPEQEKRLRAMCEYKGYEIYKIYKDDGISAKTGNYRPTFEELLQDIKNKKCNTIVVLHFLFLIIVFFNQFNKEVMKNNYVIIGYFIMTIEFILFNYLSIWNAKRDTAKLLKDNK